MSSHNSLPDRTAECPTLLALLASPFLDLMAFSVEVRGKVVRKGHRMDSTVAQGNKFGGRGFRFLSLSLSPVKLQ